MHDAGVSRSRSRRVTSSAAEQSMHAPMPARPSPVGETSLVSKVRAERAATE